MSTTPTTPPPPPEAGGDDAPDTRRRGAAEADSGPLPEQVTERALEVLDEVPPETPRSAFLRAAALREDHEQVVSAVRDLRRTIGDLATKTDALDTSVTNLGPRIDELSGTLLFVAGRVEFLTERTRTLCEVSEAGFREIREDLIGWRRETRDDVRAIEQLVDREVQGMHGTIEVLGTQVIENRGRLDMGEKRWAEHGARIGAIEADAGEVGDGTEAKPGHGWRFKLATLWAEHGQRQKSNALALGGGALASGPLVYAVVEIIKALMGH